MTDGAPQPEFLHRGPDGLVVRFQMAVYGRDAVAKTAHRFTDRVFAHMEEDDAGWIVCRLKPKGADADMEQIAGEFANEALDQMLRARLAAETEPLRRLLLAQAFSRTNLLHPELDAGDPVRDPLRVVEPDDAGH